MRNRSAANHGTMRDEGAERIRTAGSSPSTVSCQDDAERWVSWGPRWRWHRLTGRGKQIVTACGAWTWASTPTEMIVGYPGATACRKCAKKRARS